MPGSQPDPDSQPSYAELLDEFGMRFSERWSFNQTYTNASLAALWAAISIFVAGPQAIMLVGIPKILITLHLMLALHMFEVVIVGYYMAAEQYSSPQGGDRDGAGAENEASH